MRYLFMCKSLTYAQKASKTLERGGIISNIVKAPSAISVNGCAYCVAVSLSKGKHAAELLKSANMIQGKIYIQELDGGYKEVSF